MWKLLKVQDLCLILLNLFILLLGTGCSNEDDQLGRAFCVNQVSKLKLEFAKIGFENESVTRSDSESDWTNGDKIYLLFQSKSTLAYGDVVFSNGSWILNYDGELFADSIAKCKAYFFENQVSSTFANVTLSENSIIYEDCEGTYKLVDGCLSVNAALQPKTGRICFKGYNHQEIQLSGISHYTSFNRFTGEYQASDVKLNAKVSGEFTEFCYGFFTDADEPCIKLWSEGDGFKRYLSPEVFKPSDSGYLTIPSPTAHNGWLLLFE